MDRRYGAASAPPGPTPPPAGIVTLPDVQAITSIAYNADLSMAALCNNSNEVRVYRIGRGGSDWERVAVLSEHEQLVSGIDWGHQKNRIVTCSHDRNAYVWELKKGEWKPTLVQAQSARALTCVRWSPKENKFAAGTGAKCVVVAVYEEENDWWGAKKISSVDSTVLSVDWHPDNILLAAGTADCKVKVFAAFVRDVDQRSASRSPLLPEKPKFGEQLYEFTAGGWVHAVRWSPSGDRLAAAAHDGKVTLFSMSSAAVPTQSVRSGELPATCLAWLSESALLAAGFEGAPAMLSADGRGTWTKRATLERAGSSGGPPPARASEAAAGLERSASQVRAALQKFKDLSERGQEQSPEPPPGAGPATRHTNSVTSLLALPAGAGLATGARPAAASAGLDGRVVFWDSQSLPDLASLSL